MPEITLPESLLKQKTFSRREYTDAMSSTYHLTDPQIAYDLNKRLKGGEIVKQGWGQYRTSTTKRPYHHDYSDLARAIADRINQEYIDLNFRIFEYIQLNEFMNHQMAKNVIFVFVENEFTDFVFNTLFDAYPGKVMLKPRLDDFYRYSQNDQIVIFRLASEAPKGIDADWHVRIEQILVDMLVDKFFSYFIPESEKERILEGAFETYLVDEKTMIRYAKRKGAEDKLKLSLSKYREVAAV